MDGKNGLIKNAEWRTANENETNSSDEIMLLNRVQIINQLT